MAFFNEFPHTRTYDSDLAWLIKRMKEVLSRMDSVEARMKALEDLIANFIENLHIDELIKQYILEMIINGDLDILTGIEPFDVARITSNMIVDPDSSSTSGKAAKAKLLNGFIFRSGAFNIIYFEDYVTQFISPYGATDIFGVELEDDVIAKFFGAGANRVELYNKLKTRGYVDTFASGTGASTIMIEGVFNDSTPKTSGGFRVASSGTVELVYSLGSVRAQNSTNNVAAHMIIVPNFFN